LAPPAFVIDARMAWLTRRDGARRALWACVLVGGVALAIAAQAEAPEAAQASPATAADPGDYGLSAVSDPLERASAVAKLGDARVLSLLEVKRGEHGAVTDAERVLAALASVRWLADVAPAVPALIELMQGRDPDLAPAAARALVEVSRALVESDRVPESVSADSIGTWTAQLAPLEQNGRVRSDIRLAATEAIALLNAARERL
jgi:hypothetical protein